jgi:hypothetical protein
MIVSDESVRLFTGRIEDDRTTPAVVLAVALVEALIGPLTVTEHTETLPVHRLSSGQRVVFPRHRPVTTVDDGWSVLTPAMIAVPDLEYGPDAEVTYSAGWTEATVPADIAMIVAQIADRFAQIQENEGVEVLPEFESVSLDGAGGKRVDPGPWGIERLAPGATAILRRRKVGR